MVEVKIMPQYPVIKRQSGVYEERLDDRWLAEYAEDPDTGLWRADVYHHDVAVWRSDAYVSIEDAQQAAHAYYDQQ